MRYILLLVFISFSNAVTFAQSSNDISKDSIYNIQDPVIIRTSLGDSISAIIAVKKGVTQPLPVVLFYTTYLQGPDDVNFAKWSADRDYVGVVAYARGIRTNLKNYFPYEHEATDIYEIIDWLSKQSWCNGKVGMYGGSYTGFSQWAAMKKIHPALKTIVPQVAVMPGFDMPMENNIPLSNTLVWSNDILNYNKLSNDLNDIWFKKGSSYRSMDNLAGQPNAIFQRWLQHPDYDSYWSSKKPSPQEYANINIPILATTGYYDGSQIGALQYLKEFYKYNHSSDMYFVIGPYDHWGGQRKPASNLMGYQIDSVANVNMRDLAYQWLDYILKDTPKPELLKDKINYEVMGANEWKHAPSLEKMNNSILTFRLSNKRTGERFLLSNASNVSAKSFIEQTVDLKDRKTQYNYFTPFIINDSLDASNGIVYTTEPFKEAFSINGSFFGELKAAINKKDMDVSIAFYEQQRDGKYFYLTRYLGRASYSKDNTKRNLLEPGRKETISFDNTRLVSKQFSRGSRLVMILNINKHPYEVINYGTGRDVSDETIKDAKEPLKIKWFSDSFIKIPIWK